MWAEKHRPETTGDLVGNQEEIKQVIEYLKFFDPEKDPLMLYGPPGVGKTTCVHTISSDLGMEWREMNASDERTQKKLVEDAELIDSVQSSGFNPETNQLTIIDEVDCLDRGGAKAVREALDCATQPVILICNDLYDGVSRSIRDRCEMIEFSHPDTGEVLARMQQILKEEGMENWNQERLIDIADMADGDVRGAVNDLHSYAVGQWKKERINIPDDRPDSLCLMGPEDIDPEDTRTILSDMRGQIEEAQRVHVILCPGFGVEATLWMLEETDIDFRWVAPFGPPGMDDMWEGRDDDWKRDAVRHQLRESDQASRMRPPWTWRDEADWAEFADRFVCGDGHTSVLGTEDSWGIWDHLPEDKTRDMGILV